MGIIYFLNIISRTGLLVFSTQCTDTRPIITKVTKNGDFETKSTKFKIDANNIQVTA